MFISLFKCNLSMTQVKTSFNNLLINTLALFVLFYYVHIYFFSYILIYIYIVSKYFWTHKFVRHFS